MRVLPRHLRVALFVAACLSVLAIPTPATAAPALPMPAGWPLRGAPVVQRGFAPPALAWASGHRGIDLVAKPGEEILAAASGTVRFAGSIAGKTVVSIDHGSVRTTYEPVVSTLRVGERVELGQVIGCCCLAIAMAGSGWSRSRSGRSCSARPRLVRRRPDPQLRPVRSPHLHGPVVTGFSFR